MAESTIRVELVWAGPEHVVMRRIELARGSTVTQAIGVSGIAEAIPGGVIDAARIGLFSHRVTLDHVLQEGDRIEIYRPLLLDPMEARRRRAR